MVSISEFNFVGLIGLGFTSGAISGYCIARMIGAKPSEVAAESELASPKTENPQVALYKIPLEYRELIDAAQKKSLDILSRTQGSNASNLNTISRFAQDVSSRILPELISSYDRITENGEGELIKLRVGRSVEDIFSETLEELNEILDIAVEEPEILSLNNEKVPFSQNVIDIIRIEEYLHKLRYQ